MDQQPFSWDALQSFLAIVRAGRLTEAARRLGVTHSTLSRRVAALEASLQAQLFHRSPAGYALTPPGERLYEQAQAIESLALAAASDIAGDRLRVAGIIRIGAPDGFGTFFLAPRLGALGAAHPELAIQLVTLPRVFSLSKREADIAIGLSPPAEGRLVARRLTEYELGLYGAESYLAAHKPIERAADLPAHRFIGYIEDMIYAPELDYLPLICPDAKPAFASSNLAVQFGAAVAGLGLCVLPCFMAQADPRLRRVLAASAVLTRAFWLIVHADMRDLVRVRVTGDFIAAQARAARQLFLPQPA